MTGDLIIRFCLHITPHTQLHKVCDDAITERFSDRMTQQIQGEKAPAAFL